MSDAEGVRGVEFQRSHRRRSSSLRCKEDELCVVLVLVTVGCSVPQRDDGDHARCNGAVQPGCSTDAAVEMPNAFLTSYHDDESAEVL